MSDENVKYPTPVVVGVTKNEVPRGAYRFLTDDDVLCKGDLVRDTYLLADLSGSDFHDPKSSILVNWRLVDDVMPYWIGARLGDFNEGPDPEQPRKFPCEAIRAALSGEGTGGAATKERDAGEPETWEGWERKAEADYTLLDEKSSLADMAEWLDGIADTAEGENNNDAWNLRAIMRRLQSFDRAAVPPEGSDRESERREADT